MKVAVTNLEVIKKVADCNLLMAVALKENWVLTEAESKVVSDGLLAAARMLNDIIDQAEAPPENN